MRRGLSLIEVVAATALLAIVVATCLPFFQSASAIGAGAPSGGGEHAALLGAAADRIVQMAPWRSDSDHSTQAREITVSWPPELRAALAGTGLEGSMIRIKPRKSSGHAGTDGESASDEGNASKRLEGDWIEFRSGDAAVHRWVARPRTQRGRRAIPRRRPRKRRDTPRGMTLVEVVLALALLSTLAVAAMSWATVSARIARTVDDRTDRESAARNVLRLIGDDLRTFDREEDPARARSQARRSREARSDRVRIEGSALVVRTRDPGASGITVEHRYGFDASTGTLRLAGPYGSSLHTRPSGPERLTSGGGHGRELMGGVASFECSIDEQIRTLTVAIDIDGGGRVSRSFLLP